MSNRRKIWGTAFYEDATDAMMTLNNAEVEIFQAGTSISVDMYSSEAGGTPIGTLLTGEDGYFECWIEYSDFIKLVISKTGYDNIVRDDVWIPSTILDGGSF